MIEPLVSVIIPTYNSARTLRRCIESLKAQTYRRIELIVVDNFSNDETVEIARKYGVRVLFKGNERTAQKNWGAVNSRGDLLCFVDSDFVLESDFIIKGVRACRFFDAVSVINFSVGESLWGKAIALKEKFLAFDPTIQTIRFIRRKVFFDVGGFDEGLVVGEDLDLYARVKEKGYKIGWVDAIEWHIGEPQTLRDIAKRNFYYGKKVRSYFRKRGKLAVNQLSPFKPELFYVLVKSGSPYLFVLVIVDLVRWFSSFLGLICSLLY
jgi:glycosyltransferase involved in cell wall biosynthesis